jgi:hypothetical protein
LAPIDFGYAQLRKTLELRQLMGLNPRNQEELMLYALEFSKKLEWIAPEAARIGHPLPKTVLAAQKWIERIDAMLNYDAMEKTVEAIKSLCTRNGGNDLKALLRQALPPGAPADMIDEAFAVLTERAELLEKVLRTRFIKFKRAGDAAQQQPSWLDEAGIIAFAE